LKFIFGPAGNWKKPGWSGFELTFHRFSKEDQSMTPEKQVSSQRTNVAQIKLLRIFLGFSAFAWGVSVFGVFMSWPAASQALEGLGAKPIAYDRMLDYWLRMASGAFTLVGCWYFILMIKPQKYHAAIPWFGALMIVEGIILLVHGVRLSLPPFPFYADTAACLLGGAGILWLSPCAKPDFCPDVKS
jgi:hypothetical protein